VALRKALYGALFVVALPLLLVAWARATASVIPLAAPFTPWVGLAASAAGLALMLSGTAALWLHGGGLPMNAFPPPRYVTRGIYRLVAHPIYIGFSMLVAGVAVAMRSGSGFWLVSPAAMLGCAALVLGYERDDLIRRFGYLPRPLIRLAADAPTAPSVSERISWYLLVLIPWLILYEAVRALGAPPDARIAHLPFEARLPVLEWTEIFYFSIYPLTCAAPFVAGSRRDLRRFSIRGLVAMAVVFPLYLAVPLIAPPRPFTPHCPLGALLVWERAIDTPAAAFPSFHVIWALLAAEAFAGRMPRLKWLWRGWAVLVSASCVTTGNHAVVDVAGGFGVVALVASGTKVWGLLRRATERIANSWKEWQWGGVRVINHGAYAGVGSFLALAIVGELVGPGHGAAVLLTGVCSLVCAGLWAQYIEGSPRLLRPYGYYGGVIGVALGAFAGPLLATSAWLLLAAYSVAGPWVQSLGRLRCLVQGCCHGRPAPKEIGIRYRHPRSRVCRLSEWKDVPLHPTPLYSILWNGYIALAMMRLWSLHASLSLIAGLYLILTGLGRFVEEAYRGEPQTPVYAGLRLYQWVAIATVLAGALVTAAHAAPPPAPQFRWEPLVPAAAFGLLTTLALGVDFPNSNRRFARLV
jgi:protein-S-isoprenylcysteine O-methyltransferase Ste14